MHKWTNDEEKLLLSLYKEKTLDELAEMLHLSRMQVQSKGWRLNIIFMDCWTLEQDAFVKEHFKNMTYQEIGRELGRTKSAVQSRCRKLGLIKSYRSYKSELNSNYFEVIDTEEKAYWLGFICADGCVSYNKSVKGYSFKITLQRSDSDYLRKFIKAIDGKFDLKLKTQKVKNNGSYKCYDICEVSFRDKKFTSDLLQYFSTNKTDYIRIPSQIPKNLIRHFIRGFSDGDGCFYCNLQHRRKSFEIVGKSLDMLEDIQKILAENSIQSSIYKKRENNWKLMIVKLSELIKFQSYLYDGATIFMDRKYKKSQEILLLAS